VLEPVSAPKGLIQKCSLRVDIAAEATAMTLQEVVLDNVEIVTTVAAAVVTAAAAAAAAAVVLVVVLVVVVVVMAGTAFASGRRAARVGSAAQPQPSCQQ
jgi:hypothetical protein